MTAFHPKAKQWINSGIFNCLTAFEELEERINKLSEEKDRGDVFEIFIEAYLATQSITQRVKHWVVGNVPLPLRERYKLPSDATGIDGIYEVHDGSHVAYQVKYRRSGRLNFADVAPFLGITEKFSDRVIFTNAATLSDKAHDRSRWVSGDVFRSLPSSAFASIENWLKEKPVPIKRLEPDPSYQTQALAEIKATLGSHDRGTVVMACGTGKTLVALWATEQAKASTVLVVVPSLTLINQTLTEWSQQTSLGERFSYICVCSDPTVGLKDDDALNIDKSDLGFRIDTDPEIVRSFLKRHSDEVKIVFSTYQSSPTVGQGAVGLPAFDFAIFDEAHKTTGYSGPAFGFGLSDDNIRIKKRLFLTATPRHIDIRHRDKEGEFDVNSMDDETLYGPRAHTLSFAAAARKGIICPYKVIISLIDKEMVDDFTRKHGITIVKNDEVAARWVANLIALQRAVEAVGANKVISFHSRVRLAQEFAASNTHGLPYYLPGYDVRHVNGEQRSADRSAIIQAFRLSSKAVLTNARCLTEGVDIPAVDMVAFIDPRQSRIDIAQAVGRAMRKPRGLTTKTVGYVVVPLFAGMRDDDSLDAAIKSEKFAAIADVLNALQEHDEELVDIIREIKEHKGAGKPFNPRRLDEKIEVLGPRVDLDRLSQSIFVELVDAVGSTWDEWYGRLKEFKAREGHCWVPTGFKAASGYLLGNWVSNQRGFRDAMPVERRRRLDELGFVWDSLEAQWEEAINHLKAFKDREGHCRVPADFKVTSGYSLGSWVGVQRRLRDTMLVERRRRLDELGFLWDPFEQQWEEGFSHLKAFKDREGHCRVPADFKTTSGYSLGRWASGQRRLRDALLIERRRRLDELGFVWDHLDARWEEGFSHLKAFKDREGHCRVPQRFKTTSGYKLGTWVTHQRDAHNDLPTERRRRLDELGFVWDHLDARWEEGFSHLKAFKDHEGHCRVPRSFRFESGYSLGIWVKTQRNLRDGMPVERRRRLNELGFAWDALETSWEEGFSHLKAFKDREGHCRVPTVLKTPSGYPLGKWVSRQRRRSGHKDFPTDQRRRLDELGFDWDTYENSWEKAFGHLKTFKDQKGHCRVPERFKTTSGYSLGHWVGTQRHKRDAMPVERRRRLDELGFVWDTKKSLG